MSKEQAELCRWLEEVTDPELSAELLSIRNEEKEVHERFYRSLEFGTGGLRGELGAGTNRMNIYTVRQATQGFAAYLLTQDEKPSAAISYDSRHKSDVFARETARVLAANGIKVYLYPHLMPTPALSFAVLDRHCTGGVMVTASHNPAQYNGYKVYGSDGCQITQEAAESITDCIEKVPYGAPQSMPEAESRAAGLLRDVPEEIVDRFLEKTLSCRVAPEAEAPLHLIYTPLHGTGLEPVTKTFRRMKGIQFTCVTEQTTPDGHFPTCPKPNPELREALRCGLELAEKENASLLIATDPDCDRVGVAVREKDGRYTVLTGNEVGLLLLEHILKTRTALGTMPENPVVVKTIVTSDLAFAIARRYGAEVTECLTGFEIIGRLEQEGHSERYVFGFEESCGYLAGTHVRDKDGVMGSMLVAEMAQCAAAEGRTLAEEMERLYETYGFMENRLLNFDIAGAEPMKEMARVMASLRAEPLSSLSGSPVETVKDYAPGIEGLPKSDVLSYQTADGKKAIVRPSGTEPKVKVYLSARAASRAEAEAALNRMEAEINERVLGK